MMEASSQGQEADTSCPQSMVSVAGADQGYLATSSRAFYGWISRSSCQGLSLPPFSPTQGAGPSVSVRPNPSSSLDDAICACDTTCGCDFCSCGCDICSCGCEAGHSIQEKVSCFLFVHKSAFRRVYLYLRHGHLQHGSLLRY